MADLVSKDTVKPATDFSVLSGVGKFISFLGWIVVFFSFVSFLVYAISQQPLSGGDFIPLAICVFFAIGGLLVVAMGEMTSCLVAIERNTKNTANYVKQINGSQFIGNESNSDKESKSVN